MVRSRSGAIAATVAIAIALASGSRTQQRSTATPVAGAEFPSADSALWREVQSDLHQFTARRLLEDGLATPELAEALIEAGRVAEAAAVLQRLLEQGPDQLRQVARVLAGRMSTMVVDSRTTSVHSSLETLTQTAFASLSQLPREDAAWAAFDLATAEMWLYRPRPVPTERRSRLMIEYRGTQAVLAEEARALSFRQGAVDAFVEQNLGTCVAAEALYQKALRLRSVTTEPPKTDPTDRILQVITIVEQLEDAPYSACDTRQRAADLVIQFYVSQQAVYAPENIPRVLAAFENFLATHFAVAPGGALSNGIGFMVAWRMWPLYRANGEGVSGIERMFDRLERSTGQPSAVRYLRGVFYTWPQHQPSDREAFRVRAIDVLSRLAREGGDLYNRVALAEVGSLYFSAGDFEGAADAFARYLDSYPKNDWAWVAALRLGQSEAERGNWQAARRAFERATEFSGLPHSQVLGRVYAGRTLEAVNDFQAAATLYRQAVDVWGPDVTRVYALEIMPPPFNAPFRARVGWLTVTSRVREMEEVAGLNGAERVEQARWLAQLGQVDAALAHLADVAAASPNSDLASACQSIGRRIRLEHALQLTDSRNAARDPVRARQEFDALSKEPFDFSTLAATLASASFNVAEGGDPSGEASRMTRALEDWIPLQKKAPVPDAGSADESLVGDVTAIRTLVFQPQGQSVFSTTGPRWNDYVWPTATPRFVLVNSDVVVKIAGSETIQLGVRPSVEESSALFFDSVEIRTLDQLFFNVWRPDPPSAAQPASRERANRVAGLWQLVLPGTLGIGRVQTFPIVAQIEFLDVERTRAIARVRVGSGGAMIPLEKIDGVWVARELTGSWIS